MKELINKYGDFSDGLILRFDFQNIIGNPYSKGDIQLLIRCMNAENDYEFENIILYFKEVIEFKLIETIDNYSFVINPALITTENDIIIFDFLPITMNGTDYLENPNSTFMIKSKIVNYEVVDSSIHEKYGVKS